MQKRTIILEDQELIFNEEKPDCPLCHIGIPHETVEEFLDECTEGPLGLNAFQDSIAEEDGGYRRSEVMERLYTNYSKLELVILIDTLKAKLSKLSMCGDIGKAIAESIGQELGTPRIDDEPEGLLASFISKYKKNSK